MLQYDSKYEERFKGSWGIPEYRWMFAPNESAKFVHKIGIINMRNERTAFRESLICNKALRITITSKGSMYRGCTNSPTDM
jgi:phosphoribosylformylglycinamidine (FGAM) synthase-like amidotransferase family enzyme